jgi:two-component system CheB/CheR fusion protein
MHRDGNRETSITELVSAELRPFDGANIGLEGVEVALAPRAGMSFALTLHELASNAAKYGALSTPSGRLEVRWDVVQSEDGEVLEFNWAESDGPLVEPPAVSGFGSKLINQTLPYEFDAVIDQTFAPTGMICRIRIPMGQQFGILRGPRNLGDAK